MQYKQKPEFRANYIINQLDDLSLQINYAITNKKIKINNNKIQLRVDEPKKKKKLYL